jgi:hypothetical protein
MPSRCPVWILVSVLIVAGCAGVDRVVPEYSNIYSPLEVSYASSGRDFTTVVRGMPFAGEQAAFDKAVTDALQRYYAGPPTTFTTLPDETARPLYRVVLWFNPAVPVPNLALCLQRELPTGPASDRIEVQAAFCRGGGMASSATGYLDGVRSVDDPGFRHLMADITYSLFPPYNPENRGIDCDRLHRIGCPAVMKSPTHPGSDAPPPISKRDQARG